VFPYGINVREAYGIVRDDTARGAHALSREKGWERVVAFQTRNPLDRRAHEAHVYGLGTLIRQGVHGGAVLNPLVGETKGDDVDWTTLSAQ
jgi:sulfate adenylyltransferase